MNESSPRPGISTDELRRAVAVLARGGVVAFPTETYYGLAVDPFNPSALARLFALKRRPSGKPVLILINGPEELPRLARGIPARYEILMKRYWPGPLTLIFEARSGLPALLTGGSGTIGVRVSSHPVARALVHAYGGPVTATSANISGREPAVNPAAVREQLGDGMDLVVAGGETSGGMPSTIVGIADGRLALLRAGAVAGAGIPAPARPSG